MGGGATVVRQARRDRRDPDKGIEAPRCSRTVSGVRVTRQENPDVKSKVKAARGVRRRLLSEFGKLIAMLVLAFCFKGNNQNKHLFAPPPRRFLNYRVGPQDTAHARQSAAPPLARKYVGKIFAAATTIAGINQSKRLCGFSLTPKGQSEAGDCPPRALRLRFQSKSATLFLRLFIAAVPLLTSNPEDLTCRLVYCDRIVWSALYTTVLKAPPSQAPYLAAVSRTDRKISTLPEHCNPLKRQFRPHPPANPLQWRGGRHFTLAIGQVLR